MPAKNTVKQYVENGYYHVYNRGIDGREIYQDDQDYKVFLSYLAYYLSPPPEKSEHKKLVSVAGKIFEGVARLPNNYVDEVELVAYALMPNHFHLLVFQKTRDGLPRLIQSLGTRFTMYFNKRHSRKGSLFESRYKACLVEKEEYLLHLSRYIHLNPKALADDLENAYSSYGDFVGQRSTEWLKPDHVSDYFNEKFSGTSYRDFVEGDVDSAKILGELVIEDTL